MSKRKEPANETVTFFETAPLDTAETVLGICKGIVARRKGPKAASTRKARAPRAAATESASTEQA